jgi:hypothetical protein
MVTVKKDIERNTMVIKKKIITGVILAVSLAGLTACGSKSEEAPVVDQTEVATSGTDSNTDTSTGTPSENGTPATNGSVDANGKPIVDLSTLEYAKTSDIALKAFTKVVTDGAKLADKASAPTKTAPTGDAYGKGISSIETEVPFAKINISGTAPKITIVAESGKFKCTAVVLWAAAGGSKITDVSCK